MKSNGFRRDPERPAIQRPDESRMWEHVREPELLSPFKHPVEGPRLVRGNGYVCTRCQKGVRRTLVSR